MNTDQKSIKNKVLLNLAQMLGSVSQACKIMDYSLDSFHRFKEMYDKGGELALQEISHRKPCIKNRVEEHIEKSIVELAVDKPALGQVRVANPGRGNHHAPFGSVSTIRNANTQANTVSERRPCKRSWIRHTWRGRRCWTV